eukprot:CAMPEP_0202967224 /NCGR_PEP_ID=MMETSP1396-20130829/12016_1 /ASSEMBLY_ACC=CAM_ASM_000872 /TAXON_ID= /ORGANISM="Pseudokeronopsis sp., Strain Brazil" /LENGTH=53 /DNA_ID=CAMNT_0049692027 /DNA_START=475 /DNA_END=636 /DNA_ORIENTATION=-
MGNVVEFQSENMEAFNQVAEDADEVLYFSVGAYQDYYEMNNMLKYSHELISGN